MASDIIYSSQHIHSKTSNLELIKKSQRCRICLQDDDNLLSLPCDCRDDMGKVHLKCFCKWVETITPPKVIPKMTQVKCQICLKTMKIEVESQNKIKNCAQIRRNHSNCQIFSAFASILVISFLIYLCIQGIVSAFGGIFIMYIVFSIAIVFLLVILKVAIQLTLRIFRKRTIVALKFIYQQNRNREQTQEK